MAKAATITAFEQNLKAGTKLTVEVSEPGAKKPKKGSVTVAATRWAGYTTYSYKTGKLPAGKTTVRFYETVNHKLKLVRTASVVVRASTPANLKLPAGVTHAAITEYSKSLKAGTVLTAKIFKPGSGRPVQTSVTVNATAPKGYTDYSLNTGTLPVGTARIEIYERVGGKLKRLFSGTVVVSGTATGVAARAPRPAGLSWTGA